MKKKDNWLKLDNAAKVFPYISNNNTSNVFRVSYVLKEKINNLILQEAVSDLKDRFPTFFVKLKKGAFWFYFESNDNEFCVKPESPFVCDYKNNDYKYFLDIFYYENRISVEVFHAIGDASGAIQLLNAILYRYLVLLGKDIKDKENKIILFDSEIRQLELEDSFNKYFSNSKNKRLTPNKAHRIKGTKFDINGQGIISGVMDVSEIKKISNQYNATITEFLVAVLLKSVFMYVKTSKKPINIFVPVNLRKYFDSETLRNFSLYIYISKMIDESNIEELLKFIKIQFKEQLEKENLQTTLDSNVKLEKIFALRFCPLFLKTLLFKLGYGIIAGGLETMSLSNLGKIDLPECLNEHINYAEFIIGAGNDSTNNLGIITVNNKICMSFSRKIKETEIEKYFFRQLKDYGVDITIITNRWEEI